MAPEKLVRVTFSCPEELREKLTTKSDTQGIPRSQFIVELLEYALGAEDKGVSRGAEVNRFLFDVQERIADLEMWRREINEWKSSSDVNTGNLEATIAEILNEQLTEVEQSSTPKKDAIPQPKK